MEKLRADCEAFVGERCPFWLLTGDSWGPLGGATVDYGDYQGRTPLHEATALGQDVMAKRVQEMRPSQAAYYGHQNLVELLLDKARAHQM